MKILSFGSLNIDHVYNVEKIVPEKETISAVGYSVGLGGKGLNQTVAIRRAGMKVYHAGGVSETDDTMLPFLEKSDIETKYIIKKDEPTGHAIIQLDKDKQNAIIVYGGANRAIEKPEIDEILSDFEKGDFLVIQNEINNLKYVIEKASEIGMKIFLTPAPIDANVFELPIEKVDYLLLNEVEGASIAKMSGTFEEVVEALSAKFPNTHIVMTLGGDGVMYRYKEDTVALKALPVSVVDTTAAGDTFAGYFIASVASGNETSKALQIATKAASIAVSKKGAVNSIPYIKEVIL